MKKIAVVCAPGIGDALILHIVSCQLQNHGYAVTTFSNHLAGFGPWLNGYKFAPQPDLERIEEIFAEFDAVFLQHDNSEKAKRIHSLSMPVYTFYGSHVPAKHGPLKEGYDFVCDPDATMVDNVVDAIENLFKFKSKNVNGMQALPGLVHRRFKKRVAIHTTSAVADKNWPLEKFRKVADWMKIQGLDPFFLAEFPTLEDLASFIYESGFFIGNDSGPGHIASCLKIPHLIIGRDEKQMRLWRPGWLSGEIVVPPSWIPNGKGLRLKKKYWKNLIITKKVINGFKNNVLNN